MRDSTSGAVVTGSMMLHLVAVNIMADMEMDQQASAAMKNDEPTVLRCNTQSECEASNTPFAVPVTGGIKQEQQVKAEKQD